MATGGPVRGSTARAERSMPFYHRRVSTQPLRVVAIADVVPAIVRTPHCTPSPSSSTFLLPDNKYLGDAFSRALQTLARPTRPIFPLHRLASEKCATVLDVDCATQQIKLIFMRECPHLLDGSAPLTNRDMRRLFHLYDFKFFEGLLIQTVEKYDIAFTFNVVHNEGADVVAGKFSHDERCCCIHINAALISHNIPHALGIHEGVPCYKNNTQVTREARPVVVSGLPCYDQVDVIMRVFEHELAHFLFFAMFTDIDDSHGGEFKAIAFALFRHASVVHQLRPMQSKS